MDLSTLVVSLLMNFQTPLVIAAIGSSIWLSIRMRSGNGGGFPSNRLLAWVAFVTALLICIVSVGECVLVLRAGAIGSAVMPTLMALLWGYFARQSYRILNRLV